MTAQERALWQRIQRRAALLSPDFAAAVLVSFAALRETLSQADVEAAIRSGAADRLFQQVLSAAVLYAAFMPVRERLRRGIGDAVRFVSRDLPKPPAPATLTVSFDSLNPRVIDAIRTLETRVIGALEQSVRETVKTAVERGLQAGLNPRAVAVELRSVIGLGPTQLQEVENFRDALLGLNGRSVTDYTLRDKRLTKTSTPKQVDRAVAAYTKRRIAQNAETVARTASLNAQKLGQRLAWEAAVEQGAVDPRRLMKQWLGVMDLRERDAHIAMERKIVPFDEQWPVDGGVMIPGENTYNCRCVARYFVQSAA